MDPLEHIPEEYRPAAQAIYESVRELVHTEKEIALQLTDEGDIYPTVILLDDATGRVIGRVMATEMDKWLGLKAAALLFQALRPNALVLLFDAHMTLPNPDDPDPERWQEPGSMQRACDEEGACARGLLTDCVTVHLANTNGELNMVTLAYDYHGKGTPFRWTPEHDRVILDQLFPEDPEQGTHAQGNIPNTLRKIFSQETPARVQELFQWGRQMGLDAEQIRYHTTKAVLDRLSSVGYFTKLYLDPPYDETSGPHPENPGETEPPVAAAS